MLVYCIRLTKLLPVNKFWQEFNLMLMVKASVSPQLYLMTLFCTGSGRKTYDF